jgi:hypothetical protein
MQPSDGSDLTALFLIGSARRALTAIGLADSKRRSPKFFLPLQRFLRLGRFSKTSQIGFSTVASMVALL